MGRFITTVPNMNHLVMIKGIRLVPGVRDVGIKGSRFVAIIDDNLEGDTYEALAKQIRLLYAFSFQCSYSESYQISAGKAGYHYTGHNERKEHLLSRPMFPTQKFLISSGRIFEDLLQAPFPKSNAESLYNLVYLWVHAKEFRELHLSQEAELLLWKIVDHMQGRSTEAKAKKLLKKLGTGYNGSTMFAARVLSGVGGDKRPDLQEVLAALTALDKLRLKQEALSAGNSPHYLELEATQAAEDRNVFLSEITRLYILWQFGLHIYYLKQTGNTYRLARKSEENAS